jgi:hypothetical protein
VHLLPLAGPQVSIVGMLVAYMGGGLVLVLVGAVVEEVIISCCRG